MFDEMAITVALAKEALVFMVTGVGAVWKLPVGYCLTDGLTSDIKANMVKEYLQKLNEVGLQCIALTCDGTATNVKVCEVLGADFNKVCVKNSVFPHPSPDAPPVHCFLDATHMIKLVRSCLATKGTIVIKTAKGDLDCKKWSHIKELFPLQSEEGLRLANKLTRNHIEWERQKMKFKLAVQIFSQSVADALKSGGSGRDHTSVLACVAADGSALPPFIIYKGASLQGRWHTLGHCIHAPKMDTWRSPYSPTGSRLVCSVC